MRNVKTIGHAVEEILARMNTFAANVDDQDFNSVEFVKLACLSYALMWSIGGDPPNKDLVREIVGFDLDDLADQGELVSKEFDDIADIAKQEAIEQILGILKGRGGNHGQYN